MHSQVAWLVTWIPGGWQEASGSAGSVLSGDATRTFVSTVANDSAVVHYTFSTFATPKNSTLGAWTARFTCSVPLLTTTRSDERRHTGNNYSFVVTPQFLKFSLRRLELDLLVTCPHSTACCIQQVMAHNAQSPPLRRISPITSCMIQAKLRSRLLAFLFFPFLQPGPCSGRWSLLRWW